MNDNYERNVFINCPYTDEYTEILNPILSTLVSAGLHPMLATDRQDGGEDRLTKLFQIIEGAKFSIHDLSASIATPKKGESQRLNMPFELGLDFGCQKYGAGRLRDKVFLILEGEKYSLKIALSDIGSRDPKAHNSDPLKAIEIVRDWIENDVIKGTEGRAIPGAEKLHDQYSYFQSANKERLVLNGFSPSQATSRAKSLLVNDMEAFVEAEHTSL